jgi:hypothetical protein
MADTVCHATQGGLLLLSPFIAWIRRKAWIRVLVLTGALFGALPDIIGAYGLFVHHDHWKLYNSAHSGQIEEILGYVPMYRLHLFVDSFTHGSGKRWWVWNEMLWVETALWGINLAVIAWFVRIWRRNLRRTQQIALARRHV